MWGGAASEIADGVWYVPSLVSNLYFVGKRGQPWVMVDAGTPGMAWRIRAAAQGIFGDERPSAIVLTHGHFDHVGALEELAREWDVPIFAHPLEMPYLDGRSDYAPQDPNVGGFFGQLSRAFPRSGISVGERLRPMLIDGTMPYIPGWRVVHTPGHTPGHVSLFREQDRTLIAGDAVITLDQANPLKLFSQLREFHGPPASFTPDFSAARLSVRALDNLRPYTVAAGHGLPMSGDDVPDLLSRFAQGYTGPRSGRYVENPALADEQGLYFVPPAPRDPVPLYAAGVALAIGGLLLVNARSRRSRSMSKMPDSGEHHRETDSIRHRDDFLIPD